MKQTNRKPNSLKLLQVVKIMKVILEFNDCNSSSDNS